MNTIIIVNQSTGYLTVDICNVFAQKYDKVVLLAGSVSDYPRQLDSKVKVIPICRYDKSSIAKRMYTWIKGSLQIKNFLRKFDDKVDVLYFTNPPLCYLWADKLKQRFGLVEYDIYPDALRNVKCPDIIFQWWSKRNREIFKKSVGIITLSNGMKDQLINYSPSEKIKVIPNWSMEEDPLIVQEDKNKFVKEHNLKGKFVVLYSGNIGYTHNIETIIKVAEGVREIKEVKFVIIGNGGKKASLMNMVSERRLDNVIFSDYLPHEDVKYSMSCANLGVVTLTKETANVSVPSKTYTLLSYGIPLLNISSRNSELGNILEDYKCGESFESDEIQEIVNYIIVCLKDQEKYKEYCKNAELASKLFTKDNAKQYSEIFD